MLLSNFKLNQKVQRNASPGQFVSEAARCFRTVLTEMSCLTDLKDGESLLGEGGEPVDPIPDEEQQPEGTFEPKHNRSRSSTETCVLLQKCTYQSPCSFYLNYSDTASSPSPANTEENETTGVDVAPAGKGKRLRKADGFV